MLNMERQQGQNSRQPEFWEKPLEQLDQQEWESLCDGCGRCCLKKLIDDEQDEVIYTRVVCRFFNNSDSQCGCYLERTRLVPDCLNVKDMEIGDVNWMPDTCAYRLRFENKPLFDWHPLLAGSRDVMDRQGISIANRAISEEFVHPEGYEEHIIRWVEA
jgi:uncharacterized cysteine cluster protein YcgN (CxxCxxCC family)